MDKYETLFKEIEKTLYDDKDAEMKYYNPKNGYYLVVDGIDIGIDCKEFLQFYIAHLYPKSSGNMISKILQEVSTYYMPYDGDRVANSVTITNYAAPAWDAILNMVKRRIIDLHNKGIKITPIEVRKEILKTFGCGDTLCQDTSFMKKYSEN